MNTLIVYASTHGTTGKVAGLIWERLDKKRTHCVQVNDVHELDLRVYDLIVLGASVHFGKIQREMLVFCEQNFDILTQQSLGLYLCGMLDGVAADKEMQEAYPLAIIDNAICYMMMGGEYLLENMSLLDKMKLKYFSGYMKSASEINHENIYSFVELLKTSKACRA